jgi:hypothetical protein
LKSGATHPQVTLGLPHVAPQVELLLDPALLKNRHGGQGADTHIHSHHGSNWVWWGDLELAPESDPGCVDAKQFKLGESPTALEQLSKSSPRAILGYG